MTKIYIEKRLMNFRCTKKKNTIKFIELKIFSRQVEIPSSAGRKEFPGHRVNPNDQWGWDTVS